MPPFPQDLTACCASHRSLLAALRDHLLAASPSLTYADRALLAGLDARYQRFTATTFVHTAPSGISGKLATHSSTFNLRESWIRFDDGVDRVGNFSDGQQWQVLRSAGAIGIHSPTWRHARILSATIPASNSGYDLFVCPCAEQLHKYFAGKLAELSGACERSDDDDADAQDSGEETLSDLNMPTTTPAPKSTRHGLPRTDLQYNTPGGKIPGRIDTPSETTPSDMDEQATTSLPVKPVHGHVPGSILARLADAGMIEDPMIADVSPAPGPAQPGSAQPGRRSKQPQPGSLSRGRGAFDRAVSAEGRVSTAEDAMSSMDVASPVDTGSPMEQSTIGSSGGMRRGFSSQRTSDVRSRFAGDAVDAAEEAARKLGATWAQRLRGVSDCMRALELEVCDTSFSLLGVQLC